MTDDPQREAVRRRHASLLRLAADRSNAAESRRAAAAADRLRAEHPWLQREAVVGRLEEAALKPPRQKPSPASPSPTRRAAGFAASAVAAWAASRAADALSDLTANLTRGGPVPQPTHREIAESLDLSGTLIAGEDGEPVAAVVLLIPVEDVEALLAAVEESPAKLERAIGRRLLDVVDRVADGEDVGELPFALDEDETGA